ncbi:MAG TPA: FtsX-like permease family protein [Holophaga sp.]|nr:FtsX-like permease family protein [Holophaga sp.]
MRYLHLIFRSLLRSRRRTVLTVLSLAGSVALVAILQSVLSTLDGFANNPNSSNRIAVRHRTSITNLLPLRHEDWIRSQRDVEAVMALQWFGGVYKDPRNFFPNFASEPEPLLQVFKEEITDYSEVQFRDFLQDRNGCVVGEALAKKYGWKIGDVIPLQGTTFPINPRLTLRAIFRSRRATDEQVLHFHFKLLQEGVPYFKGSVGNFWVRAKHPEDVPRLMRAIDEHFKDAAEPTLSETENAFQLEFLKMIGNYSAMIHAITVAVLVAILIVTANTMGMAIRERSTEIAVFRAMGFTSGQMLGLLLTEGVLLSLLGTGFGLAVAYLMAGGIRAVAGGILPYLTDFSITPDTLQLCFEATLAVGLLSTFIPAYRAVRQPIVQGLRAL